MAIKFCEDGSSQQFNLTHVWKATSGGTVFSSNLVGTAFSFFDVGAAANDAIYFCWDSATTYYRGPAMASLKLNITTGITGSSIVLAWEYYCIGVAKWIPISESGVITDNTNGLTTTGANKVAFGRLAFLNGQSGVTVNGQRATFAVRCRLVSGTITGGGQHSTTAPYTYDGTIRITGYSQASPATLLDVYNAMNTTYPEVGMRRLTSETSGAYLGEAFEIPNAGFSLTTNDSWIHTENNYLKIGNNSYWYLGQIGGYWTDGIRIGNNGYNGSRIVFCFLQGSNWLHTISSVTAFYGTSVSPGRYYKTLDGALRTGSFGNGYWGMSNGSFVSCNLYGVGQGYWTGTGEITNTTINSIAVTYPAVSTMAITNLFMSGGSGNTGMIMLYDGTGTSKFRGFNWGIDSGYLFAFNTVTVGQKYWTFIDPSPKFPTNNNGTVKLANLSGSFYTTGWNVIEQYSFNIKVLDENGSPISGATVTMVDNTSTQSFSVTTDANGDIATQDVLRMHAYYSSGLVCDVKNPYVITISKTGYETYTSDITVESKTAETITLKTAHRQLLTLDGDLLHLTSPELGTSSGLLKI